MQITIKPDQYIFPPRSQDAVPRDTTDFIGEMGWLAQLKYNDTRCIIKYCTNGTVELWNRHAEKFRSYTPPETLTEQLQELRKTLGFSPTKVSMLDGGLLDQKHVLISDTIAIWDILVRDSEHLIGTTYGERYNFLLGKTNGSWSHEVPTLGQVEFGLELTNDLFIPQSYSSKDWDNLWNLVERVNAPYTTSTPTDPDYKISPVLEGLFYKDATGKLEMGYKAKNNDNWQIRSRVHTGRHRF
jgi:hypothetical protein